MIFEQGETLLERPYSLTSRVAKTGIYAAHTVVCDARSQVIRKDRFRSHLMHSPRRIGYIRVSTRAQATDRQTAALEAECDHLYVEYVSAVADERPVFDAALAALSHNDTFVVLDLDRAFRSSIDAMLTAEALRQRGVKMRILSLPIDTATAEGELFYTMVAAFANFERRIISRRTREGLDIARKRGKRLGRPPCLTPETIQDAYDWMVEEGLPCRYVAWLLGVSRLTLQRNFKRLGLPYPIHHDKGDPK